jgi:phage shock protein C
MKELKRSRTNRMVAGVCGGIGEYFEIDPNVIRLIWVVLTVLTSGAGILIYLLAWLIIPEEVPPISTGAGSASSTTTSGTSGSAGTVIEIGSER